MTVAPRIRMTWGWETSGIEADIGGLRHVATVRRESASTAALASVDCRAPAFPYGDLQSIPLHRLIGKLSRPGEGHAHALDALASLLPAGTVALALAEPAGLSVNEGFYLGDRKRGHARRTLATAHPSLAVVLPAILERTRLHRARELPDGAKLLSAYAPHASRTSIARVLACDTLLLRPEPLDALLAIPHDWFPAPGPEREAFDRTVLAATPLLQALGDHGLLASSRGRWAEFEGRVQASLRANPQGGTEPSGAVRAAIDAATALSREALVPALLAEGVLDERTLMALCGHGRGPMADTHDHAVPATMAAARLIYGGKSLPAILETSARWHAHQHEIRAGIAAIGARDGGPAYGPDAWPVPFPPTAAPNGVEIRFLGSGAELVAEGSAGTYDGIPGLSHCVGGYSHRCLDGSLSVASLRVPDGEGFRRLSTASMTVSAAGIRLGEHSGRRNAPPSREAVEALSWFLREAADRRVLPSPDYLATGWHRRARPGTVREACGFDPSLPGAAEAVLAAWAPLLPRPLRDVAGLVGAARPHLPAASLPRPPRGPAAWIRGTSAGTRVAAGGYVMLAAATALWACGILGTTAAWAGIAVLGVLPAAMFLGGALALSEGSVLLGLALKGTALIAFLTAIRTGMNFPEYRRFLDVVMGAQAVVMVLPYAWLGLTVARSAYVTAVSWFRAARFNMRRRRVGGTRSAGEALAGDLR